MLLPNAEASSADRKQLLSSTQKKIEDIKSKITRVNSIANSGNNYNNSSLWDWTRNYEKWNDYEDIEELEQNKKEQEDKVKSLLDNENANLGHYHDHSVERDFFELEDSIKISFCNKNRLLGNYLFGEGHYLRAIEHYKLATSYYEYCFPDDSEKQLELDSLRYACLCNLSYCYMMVGELREAVHSATMVLTETDQLHAKALFRRGQAYRLLDEYDNALSDLTAALDMIPGDKALLTEIQLVQDLLHSSTRNQQVFAKQSLQVNLGPDEISSTHSGNDHSEHAPGNVANKVINTKEDFASVEHIINNAIPLEPVMPLTVQGLSRY